MSYAKWQWFVRTVKHMVSPYHAPKRASFPVDENLILRQLAQRDLIGDRDPVGNRKILENTYRESTRFGATIDDDFAGPVG